MDGTTNMKMMTYAHLNARHNTTVTDKQVISTRAP